MLPLTCRGTTPSRKDLWGCQPALSTQQHTLFYGVFEQSYCVTNNSIHFALGRTQDWILLLTTQWGLPQIAESKWKGMTKRVKHAGCAAHNNFFQKFQFCFPFYPTFSSSISSPPMFSAKVPFRDTPHTCFLQSLTSVCVSPKGCEMITSEPQRRDTGFWQGINCRVRTDFFNVSVTIRGVTWVMDNSCVALHRGQVHPGKG